MRSCTVRCITESETGEAFVQVEKHLCDDCRPDGWVLLNFVAKSYGVEDATIHVRDSDAIRLGHALVAMGEELKKRKT